MTPMISELTVLSIDKLQEGIFSIWFASKEFAEKMIPGQFVMIGVNDADKMLMRPISICEIREDSFRVVFRVAGGGTRSLSECKAGEKLKVMGPLGNGYGMRDKFTRPVLFGGGIGIPPMLGLAEAIFNETGNKPQVIIGYRDKNTFLLEEFNKCAEVLIATDDGSLGFKGNVLEAAKNEYKDAPACFDVAYACGPMPMLRGVKAFSEERNISAYISLEEKMACGIGACLGCVCKTKTKGEKTNVNNQRVCKDGPVFLAADVEI